MKRRLALAAFVLALAFGCQQAALSPPAKLLGLNDMVRVGQYIVVPSTERDELRLLNMVTPLQGVRAFVGAPNPLQPLAISVLQRPTTLAVDLDYQDYVAFSVSAPAQPTIPLGTEVNGPFVYASSPGTNEISIVNIGIGGPSPDGGITVADGTTEQFVELKRLLTAGPVTAMAASTMDGGHTLYFATDDGTQATLWQTPMSSPSDMLSMTQEALELRQAALFTLPQGETIHSLLALPGNRLAIATRINGGKDGRAFIFSVGSKAITVNLNFPQPVRRLYTHAGTIDFTDAGTPPTPPGSRIFGVLDEESCGSWQCGGILAVEAFDGGIAWDLAGKVSTFATTEEQKQMLPMRFGTANIVGLAIQPAGAMVLPPIAQRPVASEVALSLLGVATLSTGGIVFFNARDLTVPDTEDGITPDLIIDPSVVGVSLLDATGNPLDVAIVPGGPDVDGGVIGANVAVPVFTNGKQVDENLTVVFEGAIPGLIGLPADGGFLYVGGGLETRAEPNDLLVSCTNPVDGGLFEDDGGFITAGLVTSRGPGGLNVQLNGTCISSTYSVRAGAGFQPFVVTGSSSGYMGRVDAGDVLEFDGVYTRHPDQIQELNFDPNAKQMRLPFYPGLTGIAPGDVWTLTVDDNYNPTLATMDPTAANCGLPVNILGPVVVNPDIEDFFFAVPSAAAIVDLNAASAARGPIESNMSCWR